MTHLEPTPTWWQRVRTFEPALLRAALAAIVVVLAAVGLDVSDVTGRIDVAWTAIFAVLPLLQGWWTRQATTPTAVVVEQATPSGEVVAGPANELVTGIVVRHLGDPLPNVHE